MLLAVDMGNSTLAAAIFGTEMLPLKTRVIPILAKNRQNVDNNAMTESLIDFIGAYRFDALGISSVFPQITKEILTILENVCGIKPFLITDKAKLPLKINYDDPAKLGTDRISAASGALTDYGHTVLIADLGTATTFTVVHDNVLDGGLIAPGIVTALNALGNKAAQLMSVDLDREPHLLGRNPEDAVRAGSIYGWAAMTEGIHLRICSQYGKNFPLVVTGGGAKLVSPHIALPHVYDEFLVLKGIRAITTLQKKD